ncbi:MAG: hypothetical protein AAF518_18035 [Spirochaetota bacterium]
MNSKMLLFLIFLFLLSSCGSGAKETKAGGACQYKEFPGTMEITKIEEDPQGIRNIYKDPVVVTFSFTPDDADAVNKYRFVKFLKDGGTLHINGGKNPPRKCIEEQGYTVGSKHKAIRTELRKGTCTPVVYLHPEFEEHKCYGMKKEGTESP